MYGRGHSRGTKRAHPPGHPWWGEEEEARIQAVEAAPPAVFLGWQEGLLPGGARPALWNVTQPVLGHPAGSTVATETLRRAGYRVEEPAQSEEVLP